MYSPQNQISKHMLGILFKDHPHTDKLRRDYVGYNAAWQELSQINLIPESFKHTYKDGEDSVDLDITVFGIMAAGVVYDESLSILEIQDDMIESINTAIKEFMIGYFDRKASEEEENTPE